MEPPMSSVDVAWSSESASTLYLFTERPSHSDLEVTAAQGGPALVIG